MSSPSFNPVCGQYVGNGGSAAQQISLGFKPQHVCVRSAAGEVVLTARMPGPWKQVDTAVPSFLAAGLKFLNLEDDQIGGFEVSGSDATLNANGTTYYYEAW